MRSSLYILAVLAVWFVVTQMDLAPAYVLPGPLSVLSAFRTSMFEGAVATFARTLVGFAAGVTLTYLLILIAHCTGSINVADAQFSAARAVPALAAMPLFLLWFGLGEVARILVVTLSVLAYVAGPWQRRPVSCLGNGEYNASASIAHGIGSTGTLWYLGPWAQ